MCTMSSKNNSLEVELVPNQSLNSDSTLPNIDNSIENENKLINIIRYSVYPFMRLVIGIPIILLYYMHEYAECIDNSKIKRLSIFNFMFSYFGMLNIIYGIFYLGNLMTARCFYKYSILINNLKYKFVLQDYYDSTTKSRKQKLSPNWIFWVDLGCTGILFIIYPTIISYAENIKNSCGSTSGVYIMMVYMAVVFWWNIVANIIYFIYRFLKK